LQKSVAHGVVALKRSLKTPEEINSDDYRIYVVISYLTYLGITVHASLILIFYLIGSDFLAAFNVLSTIAWIAARKTNHEGYHTAAIFILFTEVGVHTPLALYFFGWESGFQYYLMAGIPFLLFNHKMKLTPLLVLSGFLCALFIALYAYTSSRDYHYEYPMIITGMNYANIMASFVALTITSYYFRVASFISEQKMELLANTDLLTGLPNRRGMYPRLNAQHELLLRTATAFSVVLADIDNFKQLNDNYGHDCGDYVLKEISRLLRSRLRKYDVVGRWGGEEFLFVFPGCDSTAAASVAEDIRKTIESHLFTFNEQSFTVTMTFGVAAHRENNSIDGTIKMADAALYQGKKAGRNQAVESNETLDVTV